MGMPWLLLLAFGLGLPCESLCKVARNLCTQGGLGSMDHDRNFMVCVISARCSEHCRLSSAQSVVVVGFAGTVVIGLGWIFKTAVTRFKKWWMKRTALQIYVLQPSSIYCTLSSYFTSNYSKIPMSTAGFLGFVGRAWTHNILRLNWVWCSNTTTATQMLTKDAGMATTELSDIIDCSLYGKWWLLSV